MTSHPGQTSERRTGNHLAPAVELLAFVVGASLAMSFLTSDWGQDLVGWLKVALVGAFCGALWWGSGRARRWLGRLCGVLLLPFYALWVYLAVAFGLLLGWTVPLWLWLVVAVAAGAAVATALRRREWHVPPVLPLGIWIAAVLSGWLREENLLRCDDRLALRPPAELVVANPALASCRPGEVRPSGRFPRTIWQHPQENWGLFTTQGLAPHGFAGSVCAVRLDGGGGPSRCIGRPMSKSQGIIDLPDRDRLLVMQWGIPAPSGAMGAVVMELSRAEEPSILAEHWFDELVGDGFYEPRNSTLYMFSDRMNGIHRVRLPEFSPEPTIPSIVAPGELHYDRAAGEGVTCGQGLGVAVRGAPYSERHFVAANSFPLDKLSLTWGCAWDQTARKVYSTVPNLGLLDRIDYDTGRVEKRWFVGLGMRSVAYDGRRRRVYFTDFLRGNVLAFDEQSERVVDRWFVGRFSRWVELTRDGQALLATGNLGIVRIALEN